MFPLYSFCSGDEMAFTSASSSDKIWSSHVDQDVSFYGLRVKSTIFDFCLNWTKVTEDNNEQLIRVDD